MNIVAIIPTFNRRNELKNLLSMLGSMETSQKVVLEIVCVVDGSTDGTLEMLEEEYPLAHAVNGDGNWWYTKSMNQGFKYADRFNPDFVLTLNDDIVIHENYLDNIISGYESVNKTCIMGSVSYTHNEPIRVTNSGVKKWNKLIDKSTSYYPFLSEVNPQSMKGVYPTPVLPGRGMLIPWEILKSLNFFDEDFQQYHSDFDFTLRALKQVPVYVCWDAKIYSFLEKTGSDSSFLKSSFRSLIKSFSNPYGRKYIPNKAKYFWRHGIKLLWPLYMFKFFLLAFKNHFLKKKI